MTNLYCTTWRCVGADFSRICVHVSVKNIIISLQYPVMYILCCVSLCLGTDYRNVKSVIVKISMYVFDEGSNLAYVYLYR